MRCAVILLIICTSVYAQDVLHVTATTRSIETTRAMFGPLNKRYGSVAVSVCSQSTVAQTIPLTSIGQQPGAIPAGVTILLPIEALQVISKAQNTTKKAVAFRIGIAVVEGAAVATQLAGISVTIKSVLTDTALLGSQLIPIIESASTPNALVAYAQATLSDPLQLVPGGCASGIILTEADQMAKHADFKMPSK